MKEKTLKEAKKILEDEMADILKRLVKIEIEIYTMKKAKNGK